MKNSAKNSISNIEIKLIFICIIIFLYAFVLSNKSYAVVNNSTSALPGVCVFDFDFTLSCDGAYAAVLACKQSGFAVAINTARNKLFAYSLLETNILLNKGFDKKFIQAAKRQKGLNGPFQYKASWFDNDDIPQPQPLEQRFQSKSYGMRKIAEYYNFKLDDIESRKVILFDDTMSNIQQMQPDSSEPYSTERCIADEYGNCYYDFTYNTYVDFPRNWKIYRSKWVGSFCLRWNDPANAAQDAYEMMFKVLSDGPRDFSRDFNRD